jgi:hypothetical protein
VFGQTWYHGSIRRYIILFGTMFNDIYIRRYDNAGNMVKLIKIPITYGPKDKVIARIQADPNLNRPFAAILPYMSFELNSVQYDTSRKLNTINQIVNTDSNKNLARYNYNPVPYNFNFTLSCMVKNAEDGAKIMEQILPFFTPDWTATVRIIDDPEIIVDIPTLLNDVQVTDTWEGNFTERRALVWTLKFTMKGYLYGPTRKSKIIKKAETNIKFKLAQDSNTAIGNTASYFVAETITVQPGMTANGEPTSNVAESVDYSEISWTDDYDFAFEQFSYPAGKDQP